MIRRALATGGRLGPTRLGERAAGTLEEMMIAIAPCDRRAEAAPRRPVRRWIPMTRDEEAELAARIARGDRTARDCLVEANLGLVHTIAGDFVGRGLEMDDLVGEGHLGLIRAAQQFDPRFGARFSTYAAYWIKEAIGRALIETAPVIRVPAWMVQLLRRWRRAERVLRSSTGEEPSFDEIAASLGLSDMQRSLVARALRSRGLRSQGHCDDDFAGLLAQVADRDEDVGERLEVEDDLAEARRRLDRLEARERDVVAWHFGLDGEAQTYAQIGHRLGVTRDWAREIQVRALRKLGQA
jgi:RNA polymerase primary sigma factor